MTIQLTRATVIAGSVAAAGSQHTLDAATEAGLIYQGIATRVGADPDYSGPQPAFVNAAGTALVVPGGTEVNYQLRDTNTYIPFGDSRIAAGATDASVSSIYDNARGPYVHLQTMLGGRLRQMRNAGHTGDGSAELLARIAADVVAYAPGWCLMEGPVNDIINVVPLADIKVNIQGIYVALRAAGIKFAISTVSPWAFTTAAQKKLHGEFNRWLRTWCQDNGIPCADTYSATANMSTGAPATNTTHDGSHYSDLGAAMAARAWYDVLSQIIPATHQLTSSPFDYDNLVWSGMGDWTVGAALPTGWVTHNSSAGTPTDSVVARADWVQGALMQTVGTAAAQAALIGVAKAAREDITTTRANSTAYTVGQRRTMADGNQYICTTAGTSAAAPPTMDSGIGATTTDGTATWTRYENFNPGDLCYAEAEYFVSGVSGGNLGVLPQFVMQAQGVAGNVVEMAVTDQATRVPPHPQAGGVLRSRNFVIPSGCTGYIPYVRAYLDNGVTATLQVGRVAIKHVVSA